MDQLVELQQPIPRPKEETVQLSSGFLSTVLQDTPVGRLAPVARRVSGRIAGRLWPVFLCKHFRGINARGRSEAQTPEPWNRSAPVSICRLYARLK